MDFTEKKSVESPELRANCVSKFFYCWLVPLFKKGAKVDLVVDDLYDRLPEDDASPLGTLMEKEWDRETEAAKATGKSPSFIRTCIRIFGRQFVFLGFVVFFDEMFLRAGMPFVLKEVLHSFSATNGSKTTFHLNQFLWVCALILITWAHSIVFHKIIVNLGHLAWKARIATTSMIYRKVLKLTKSVQMEDANIGKLVNMMSSDSSRFNLMALHFHMLYIAPIQSAVLFYFLWQELGVACLTGVAIILLTLIPLQAVVGRLSVKFRTQISQRTDERGKMMSEVIGGICIIKMYAWEKPFAAVIHELRKQEMLTIKKTQYLQCVFQTIMQLSKTTVPYFTFMVYYYLGNELTAEKVFFSILVYQIILMGMVQKIPSASAQVGEFFVAIRRIEGFLSLEEVPTETPQSNTLLGDTGLHEEIGDTNLKIKAVTSKSADSDHPRILIRNLTARWTQEKLTINNISIDVAGNQLVILVGPVGAGKSSILSLLTRELSVSSGTLNVTGSLSYASQDVWIFSGTVKQNILFGSFLNEKLYNSVVNACALHEDFVQMPHGDETIVGERGITLSGGQKARINLARAIYQQADIYLMDDPLSAVDPRVSRHLFEKCIKEHLDGKLRILITHQLQYLPQADHIVVLNEQGEVVSQGSYQQLVSQGINFVSILSSGENDDSVDDSLENDSKSSDESHGDSQAVTPSSKDTTKKSEGMETGSVSLKTYCEYFKSGNSKICIMAIIFCFLGTQVAISFSEVWLSDWTNEISRRSISQDASTTGEYSDQTYALVYSVAVLALAVIMSSRSFTFYQYCMEICIQLHDRMLQALVRAPVKFFDNNSSGRILNRFTKDMNSIDESLPVAFYDFVSILLTMMATLIVVTVKNYFVLIPAVLVIFGMWKLRKFYVKTARDIKRLQSITKSPELAHLTASVQGLTTIRTSGAQEKLVDQFDSILDIHTSAFYLSLVSHRWFGICLDVICVIFLACVSFSYLILGYTETIEIGSVGLAITLTLNLMGITQWGILQSAETESFMTAVERVFEYCRIEPEAALETDEDKKPPSDWPLGGISFHNVSLSYKDSDVLVDLSFEIKPQEKIGVVGRTGAGKSSIFVALYRLTECRGDICIDGVSIKKLGLHDLRKSISIIPQDPVLFSGTMRYNLDPFEQFKDDELWQVIKEVNLGDTLPSLDVRVSDGGSNFSVGERQLVCLARAILRRNKIIVMDEATANVDPITDTIIQKAIRERFTDCTIVTIAHRLHSVIDNDRIIVLDHGRLMEFDTPANLLDKTDGVFASMVSQAGPACEAHLRELAFSNIKK